MQKRFYLRVPKYFLTPGFQLTVFSWRAGAVKSACLTGLISRNSLLLEASKPENRKFHGKTVNIGYDAMKFSY
jgi:hypothetical protein